MCFESCLEELTESIANRVQSLAPNLAKEPWFSFSQKHVRLFMVREILDVLGNMLAVPIIFVFFN